jgi:hypothetical protein
MRRKQLALANAVLHHGMDGVIQRAVPETVRLNANLYAAELRIDFRQRLRQCQAGQGQFSEVSS